MGELLPGTSRTVPTSGARRPAGRARMPVRTRRVLVGSVLLMAAYVLVQVPVGIGVTSGGGYAATSLVLLFLPHLAVAAVLAVLLATPRGDVRRTGLAGDALLLLLAGAAAAFRMVGASAAAGATATGPGAALTSVALLPGLLAALLVFRGRQAARPPEAALLLCGTVLLSTQGILTLRWLEAGAAGARAAAIGAGVAALALLGAAAVLTRTTETPAAERRPELTADQGRRTRSGWASARGLILPGAALFLAAAIADLGLRHPPTVATTGVLALLALAVAVRITQATRTGRSGVEQERQLEHTRALVEVTHALAGTTDLPETLRVISESARTVLRAGAAGIELVGEGGDYLESRAVVGMSEDILGLRFPMEGSFTGWVVRHGEPRATPDPSLDPYIQPESLAYLGRSPIAAAPIRFRDETLGVLFACNRDEPFDADELRLLGALAEQAAIGIDNARLFEQVTILSVSDPLTGLANRRQLERELEREFAAARRGRDLVAVIFDLDDFKAYNDANGHLAGDDALQAFAAALLEETRAMNLAARYGGDEFVALLAGTDAEGARAFVSRITDRFRTKSGALGRGGVSVSAGVGVFHPEMIGPEELLRQADDDLYRAKSRVEA